MEHRRRRLQSWKEIAAYFNRDERTVRRWERQRGLPVRRIPGGERNSVFAYADELDVWLSGATVEGQSALPAEAVSGADAWKDASVSPSRANELPASVPSPPPTDAPSAGADTVSASLKPAMGRKVGLAGLAGAGLLGAALAGLGVVLVTDSRIKAPSEGAASSQNIHVPPEDARDLYLTGVYHLGTRQANGLNRAIQYFTEATTRDPLYADAYVKLADAYNTISQFTLMPPDEAYPRAEAAAERAIALNPASADAYAALAFTKFYWSRQFATSKDLFERAIALDSSSAQIHHWYALTLMHGGQMEIPLKEIARAQELNPESRVILANKALILFHGGRVDEAARILRQLADAEPKLRAPREYLATLYLAEGRYQDFLREYRAAAELTGNGARLAISSAAEAGFAEGGAHGMLGAMLEAQKRQYALGQEPAYKLATTAAMLGDKAGAISYLHDSLARKEQDVLGIVIDPAFKTLRDDPDYRALVAQVGFAPPR